MKWLLMLLCLIALVSCSSGKDVIKPFDVGPPNPPTIIKVEVVQ